RLAVSTIKPRVCLWVATKMVRHLIVITHELGNNGGGSGFEPGVWNRKNGLFLKALEPIHKVVESEESVVIPSPAPDSALRDAGCGSLNIAVLRTATACAARVI